MLLLGICFSNNFNDYMKIRPFSIILLNTDNERSLVSHASKIIESKKYVLKETAF